MQQWGGFRGILGDPGTIGRNSSAARVSENFQDGSNKRNPSRNSEKSSYWQLCKFSNGHKRPRILENLGESWRIFVGEVSETWRMCKYFQRMLKGNLGDWATWKRLQRCTIAQFLLLVPPECGACFHFHYCPTVQESLQRISASHSPIFNAFGFISFNDWDFGINQPGPAILAVCESHRDVSASFSLPRRRMRSFPCRILPLHID